MPATWYDLTGFRRDLLEAIARIEADDSVRSTPYGLAIKRDVERVYGEEVNHGRLYPNLDALVEAGLVEKTEIDQRTNGYELTPKAREMLRARVDVMEDALGGRAVADGSGKEGA